MHGLGEFPAGLASERAVEQRAAGEEARVRVRAGGGAAQRGRVAPLAVRGLRRRGRRVRRADVRQQLLPVARQLVRGQRRSRDGLGHRTGIAGDHVAGPDGLHGARALLLRGPAAVLAPEFGAVRLDGGVPLPEREAQLERVVVEIGTALGGGEPEAAVVDGLVAAVLEVALLAALDVDAAGVAAPEGHGVEVGADVEGVAVAVARAGVALDGAEVRARRRQQVRGGRRRSCSASASRDGDSRSEAFDHMLSVKDIMLFSTDGSANKLSDGEDSRS